MPQYILPMIFSILQGELNLSRILAEAADFVVGRAEWEV